MTKEKRNKIIYWVATIWLALAMLSAGIIQVIGVPMEVELFNHLGFPLYAMTLLGIWKILGVAAILVPKMPLLKEWAYAGFFFTMSGAIVSHIAVGDPIGGMFPIVLTTALIFVSWYFRPADKKLS